MKHPALPANDTSRWLTFHQASTAIEGRNVGFGFDGLDGMVGIDLDDCIKDGYVSSIAAHILQLLGGTYAEVSVSGRGIKAWAYARKSIMQCNYNIEGQKVELYASNKWFMFTGKRLKAHDEIVSSGQPAVNWIESYAEKRRAPSAYADMANGGHDQAVALAMRHGGAVSGHSGHVVTFSLACKLARMGLDERGIYDILKTVHNPACSPPWSDRELQHKAKQAFEKARQ